MKPTDGVDEAIRQLREAAAASKCWTCGCLHGTVDAIERAYPAGDRPAELDSALAGARQRLAPVRYDCLGCAICFPALAANALQSSDTDGRLAIVSCPTDAAPAREGWPPFPGAYTVRRFQAPVAVCALTDAALAAQIDGVAGEEVGVTGTLETENLGIERLIQNVIANPHLRFLVLCGPDSRQAVGHRPGASLVALARNGLDDRGRIIDAPGKRPLLRNVERAAVEHFRRVVEVLDLVGVTDVEQILAATRACAARSPGPAEACVASRTFTPIIGAVPERMTPDPAGYFVVHVDRLRVRLSLEHYRNDGLLDGVVEGLRAAELYTPALEHGWVSRLDHAAYLGRELARAEHALASGEPFVQDRAAERAAPRPESCGCETTCSGGQ